MKKINKISRFLSILLVLTLIFPGFVFADNQDNQGNQRIAEKVLLEKAMEKFQPKLEEGRIKLEDNLERFFDKNDEVRVIVELKTSPSIVQASERNMSYREMSRSTINDIERKIELEQKNVKNDILSRKIDMEFLNSFKTAFNGFSGKVKYEDIKVIEKLPLVKKVYIASEYERPEIEPNMDTSNDMIGSIPTWNTGYEGEGRVIAIIDTGIDPNHRDMVLSEETNPRLTEETVEDKDLLGRYYTEKVPYGYNYYDLNNEIRDLGPEASMHGMHVAGTAGANGNTEDGGIRGVAPEAQLLAMKVFSNDPIYATTFSDIYLVAIDEAIRLGADVLNMSLGSTASFYIPDSAENIALTNATNNGIVCSVSAGNSGSMTYGWSATNYGYPWQENPDIGVVGAPGLNKDTIQVASIENTHKKENSLIYVKDGEEHGVAMAMAIAGEINPATVLSGSQEFVDCGDGSPEFLTEVEGKVALVVRGGNTPNFVDKIANAQNAGAAAIIVRNHQAGGEELINMATPDVQTIPAVFIGYTDGVALLELENKEVTFTDELISIPNPSGYLMSDTTSWGTTPSLELKPEITAPGGYIYSTLNDNKYGTMSGTSMAAPHISGGAALIMEYIKEHEVYSSLSLSEQTRLAKVLLMNTANVILDEDGIEYSPRRQGAGLMNLYGAINTPVRVVDATTNEAKVELKDFENTEFTMTFKVINETDSDAEYDVDIAVLRDYIHPLGLNLLASDYIYDADIDAPETITIPANEEVEFDVTIDIGTDESIYWNMFVEGFVTLTDPEDNYPTLSVPYVGFYGDWGEPSILDGMRFIDPEGYSYFNMSGMLCWDAEGNGYYYTTPTIYMNPGTEAGFINGTGNIMPYLSFMRNSETVDYNILDKEGNLLRTILMQEYVRKTYVNGGQNQPVRMITNAEWDGEVNGQVVPDGEYFYEIAARVHYDGSDVQSKKIPIKVDTVGPSIDNLAYNPETGMLTWNSSDKGIGILGFMFMINGEILEEEAVGEPNKASYEFNISQYINELGSYEIAVISIDELLNMDVAMVTYVKDNADAHIYIYSPSLFGEYDTSEVLFEGYVTNFAALDKVVINEIEEADIQFIENVELRHPDDPSTIIYTGPAYKFTKSLTLADGYQEVKVEAISKTGASSSLVRRFYVDTTAPELEVVLNEINKISKTAELDISMYDNLGNLYLYKGDSQVYIHEEPLAIPNPSEKVINLTVELEEGENPFVFTLRDSIGHETVKEINIILELDEEPEEPAITNVLPDEDAEFRSGETLEVSFNAPAGGEGYFKIMLPFEMSSNKLGIPMNDDNGLYTGTWTVPEGLVARNLQIEVIYVCEDGTKLYEMAGGRITVIGEIENLPESTVIIDGEAFDMDYLDNDSEAQMKLIEWLDLGKQIYVKLSEDTLVDGDGERITIELLPKRLIYFDMNGNITIFEK